MVGATAANLRTVNHAIALPMTHSTAQIRIAVEVIFPTWLLLRCLDRFGEESPHTRIEVVESVLGGTGEALLQGQIDLAVSPQVPPGFKIELFAEGLPTTHLVIVDG